MYMTGKNKNNKHQRKHKRATYRSGLEKTGAKDLHRRGVKFTYEEVKIRYLIPERHAVYTPDFDLGLFIVETKGIWDAADRKKHLLIRQQHPELDIRFVFTNSKAKISKNSTTTYADICEGRGRGEFKGVTWKYADKRIPIEWTKELKNERSSS